MDARNRSAGSLSVVVAGLLAAAPAWGGSLAPPPGPIQPTARFTLSQASTPLPYTITQPGSYVLTSNLTGGAGPDGITIAVDGVTLDLDGFVLDGAGAVGHGITIAAPVHDVTVKHGSVRAWGGVGINLDLAGNTGVLVEGVIVSDCNAGITIAGGRVADCVVRQNQTAGLLARQSIVSNCVAIGNGLLGVGDGMALFEGAKARDCVSRENTANGMFLGITSEAEGCSAMLNGQHGFFADGAGVLRGCIASGNAVDGFHLSGAQAIECAAEGNTRDGFYAEFGAVVRRCKAVVNQNAGIEAFDNTLIVDNQATQNVVSGIATQGTNARVSGNSSQRNTGDNFYLAGSVNSIYSNSASLSLAGVNYNLTGGLNDVAPISSAASAVSPVGNISY